MTGQGRALTRLVILDGEVWPAGSVPPAAVAERIRNPKCWEPIENAPYVNWGPEGMSSIGTASRPVIPAKPAASIGNRDEKPADSAVIDAQPGLPIGRDPAEPSGQAFTGPAEPAADPVLHDRVEVGDTVEASTVEASTVEASTAVLEEPPRSGKGASTAAWWAYAHQFGVETPDGASRDDIIAQLKDDGYIQ